MGLYWWLPFLACISYCVLSKAEEYDEQVMNDAFVPPTEGSIHGFRPCLDESCSALSLDSEDDDLSWHVLSAVVGAQKNIYQVSDSVTREPDVFVQHCMPLYRSTVEQISSIEARHPDIKDIKMKVIEDFIRFISDFSLLNTTDCDSPMSLIGYIKLAVRSLEVEYSQQCAEHCNCVYTAGVEEYMASTSTTDSSPTSESMDQSTSTDLPLGDEGYRCPEDTDEDSYEEIYAEDQDHSYGSSILVGSIRGVPGVNFPNYTDIPLTSFSCADKKYVPGFYADQETGCQVFHVCYEHRRESFLCPLGTIFNQPILACDYWYSSNCSLAVDYYEINVKSEEEVKEEVIKVIKEIIEDEETEVAEEHSESTDEEVDTKQVSEEHSESIDEFQAGVDIRQFLPVKAKIIDFKKPVLEGKESVTVYKQAAQNVQEVSSQIFNKMVSTATDFASKTRVVIDKVPEPNEMKLKPSYFDWSGANLKPILFPKKLDGVKAAASVPAAKIFALKSAKSVGAKIIPLAAIPVTAVKTAIPVAAKVAAVKTAIPVAAKVAAVKTAIPVAAKASIPLFSKANLLAFPAKKAAISGVKVAATVPKLAVPVFKTKMLSPAIKGKFFKAAAVPVLKANILPLKGSLAGLAPVAKAKLIKTAAISPLTKKTLALGYMKLLKAKKLALMG